MRIGSLNRNISMLEFEQAENSKAKSDEVREARAKQQNYTTDKLDANQEASALRGEAENIKSTCNAIAAGIGVAAACCAAIPIVGPIIAAILAAVAAVIVLIGQIMAKAKEDEAAAKEKDAGFKELLAEKEKQKAEDAKKVDDDRDVYVDQIREKYFELMKEDAANAKF
jgi:hypothetical protein